MQQGNPYYEWTARIRAKDNELGGSFSVLIFIGTVPDTPSEWRAAPSYVGAHHIHTYGGGKAGKVGAKAETEGFVVLNEAIAERSGLNSFEPEVVEPYLKKEIDWRIQKADRTAASVDDVPSLQIVVMATLMTYEGTDPFPQPSGEPRHYHGITEGRPGGYHS